MNGVLVYDKETTIYLGDSLLQEKEMERRLNIVRGVNISILSGSLAGRTKKAIQKKITEPVALLKSYVLGAQATHTN